MGGINISRINVSKLKKERDTQSQRELIVNEIIYVIQLYPLISIASSLGCCITGIKQNVSE